MSKFSVSLLPTEVERNTITLVKTLRKNEGWSQAELAERSGVSLGSIKRFETKGKISYESLLQLLYTLNYLESFYSVLKLENNQDIEQLFSI